MPREVSPMSASPNGVAAKPYLISMPAPPLFISPGDAASSVTRKGTKPGAARQLGEIGVLSMMSIQIADRGCHTFVVVHDGILTLCASRADPVLAAIFETIAELPDARNEYRNQPSRMIRSSSRCRARSAAPSSW